MIRKLGQVCHFYSGTGFPVAYQGKDNGEIPFYKVGDIAANVTAGNKYLSFCSNYITQEEAIELRGTIIPQNTVVFAKIGEALKLNRRAITSCDCLIDNNAMGIAPKEGILRTGYFFYYMKHLRMQDYSESTTVPSVRKSKLEQIGIDVPPLEEQRIVEERLNLLSDIILKRVQELRRLDDLIQARFVEMFGTYPANEKGWDTGTIRDLVTEVRYGSSRKAADGELGKYPYLRMNNITYGGELDLTDTKTIDIPYEELDKCTVRRGDVLFNRTNSKELVGKTCVYNRDEMMVLAGFVVRVRLNDKAYPEFVSVFLNTDFSKQMLLNMCKTAIGQANINAQELQNIGIYIPPKDIQREFIMFKDQVDKSKSAVQKALDEAQLLFDSLMQQYFG